MPLPEPRSGLVIGYAYLWHEEYLDGMEEGRKDRPCAVVLAVRQEDGDIVTTVAPITHSAPGDPHDAIELPASIKGTLGLDGARSWLVCTELNRFVWPGPDLRPIRRDAPGQFVYGMLPPGFIRQVFARIQALRESRRPVVVARTP